MIRWYVWPLLGIIVICAVAVMCWLTAASRADDAIERMWKPDDD